MTDPFQPLTVRDIPRLTRYFSARGTRLCNDSAGAAVLWQPYFQDAALELDGTLVLREQFPGLGTVFSTPVGENVGNAYDFLAKYCREVGQPLQFSPLRTPMWKTCARASASWRSRRCARGSTISTTRRTW